MSVNWILALLAGGLVLSELRRSRAARVLKSAKRARRLVSRLHNGKG